MTKKETQAQMEKRHAKEAKELAFRKGQAGSKVAKCYILVLMIVLTLAYLVDELTTNLTTALQSNIIYELFNVPLLNGSYDANSAEYLAGMNGYAGLGMVVFGFVLVLPFYKALADRFGRKIFLAINTAGMAVSMLFIMLAPNFFVFGIGFMLLNFFVPTDVHSLYFMENAPAKHRVKFTLGAKAMAILGISGIGLLRLWFLTDDVASWRNVYIIPIIIAIAVALVVVIFAKETPQFVKTRIEYLEKTDAQRQAELIEKKNEGQKTGVLAAIKFVFKHKQLKWIVITACCFGIATVVPTYYNTIMASGGMSEKQISLVVFVYPFIYSAITFLGGIISDKWGRKVMVCVYAVLSICALIAFAVTSSVMDNGIVTGLIYGLYVGGLWGTTDAVFYVMPQESSPTYLRASCMAVVLLISFSGMFVGLILWTILIQFVSYAVAAVIIAAVGVTLALFTLLTKVHETYKVDLTTVRGDEWDKVAQK